MSFAESHDRNGKGWKRGHNIGRVQSIYGRKKCVTYYIFKTFTHMTNNEEY